MRINELFSPKSAYKGKKSRDSDWETYLPDGSKLRINIRQHLGIQPETAYKVEFYRQQPSTQNRDNFGITGEGDAARILATVLKVVGAWVQKTHPDYVYFTASEPSRAKLYQTMVHRLAGQYGYNQIQVMSAPKELQQAVEGDGTPFILVKSNL